MKDNDPKTVEDLDRITTDHIYPYQYRLGISLALSVIAPMQDRITALTARLAELERATSASRR